VRERVRRWLAELLAAEGASVELAEPSDWSAWSQDHRR
jgi:hypothetical protein